MGLSIQGVEYRVKVTTGQSVAAANALTASLIRLNKAAEGTQRALLAAGHSEAAMAENIAKQQKQISALVDQQIASQTAIQGTVKAQKAATKASAAHTETVKQSTKAHTEHAQATNTMAGGMAVLSEQWKSQESWRKGIKVVDQHAQAAKAAAAAYQSMGAGIQRAGQQWKNQQNDPFQRGLQNLASQRSASAAASVAEATMIRELNARDRARTNAIARGHAEAEAAQAASIAAANAADRRRTNQIMNTGPHAPGAPFGGNLNLPPIRQGAAAAGPGALPAWMQQLRVNGPVALNTMQQITTAIQQQGQAQARTNANAKALAGSLAVVSSVMMLHHIGSFIKDTTLLAGRVENLQTVMFNVGHTASISRGQMSVLEVQMKRLGITTQVSREILTRFAQNNLRVADSLKFSRIAQDAAVVAGLNSSETAERMMIAVQRLDTRMLRNLGILVNLRNEYQRFALVTGRTENTLTANEKQQIVLNAVMRAGASLAGSYESALSDVYKQFTTLERKVEEAARAIGTNFLPIFQTVVTVADRVLDSIGDQSTGWAGLIAVLAGGAAGLSVTVAIMGAVAAFSGLATILGVTTGGLLTLLGVGAAVGVMLGLVTVGASSSAASMKRLNEEMQRQIEASAYERFQLRTLSNEIERLSKIKNRTADEEARLSNAKLEVISLLRSEEIATLAAAQGTDEYLRALRAVKRLGGPVSEADAETIARMQKRIAELNAAFAEYDRQRASIGLSEGDSAGYLDEAGGKMFAERARLRRELAAIQAESDAQALRRLDDLATATENVDQIALRAKKSMEKLILDNLEPKGASDVVENIERIKDLAAAVMSLAEIKERSELRIRRAEQDSAVAQQKVNDSTDTQAEKEKKLLELKEKLRLSVAAIKADEATAIENANNRIETTQALIRGVQDDLDRFKQSSRDMAFIAKLEAVGLGDVGKNLVQLNGIYRKAAEGGQYLSRVLSDSKKELAKLQEQMKAGDVIHGPERVAQLTALIEQITQLQQVADQGALDKFNLTLGEMAQSAKYDVAAVKELRNEVSLLRMENELLADSVDKDIIQATLQAAEANQKYEDTINGLVLVHQKLTEQIADLHKQEATPGRTDAEQKGIHAQVDALMAARKQLEDAMKAHDERRIEQEKKTVAEIDKIEKDSFEKTVKSLNDRVDAQKKKLEDLIKDRKEAVNKTDDAIFDLNLKAGNFGARGPMLDEMRKLYKEFSPLVQGAGNGGQINQLGALFNQRVSRQFGAAATKGPMAGMFANMAHKLNDEAATRLKELNNQETMLRHQALIANNSVAQVQLLKAMVIGGKTKSEIVAALAKQDALAAANVAVDDAQQKLNTIESSAAKRDSIRKAQTRLRDLQRGGGSPAEIAEAKKDLQQAFVRGNFMAHNHGARPTDLEFEAAQKALIEAKLKRDALAKGNGGGGLFGGLLGDAANFLEGSPLGDAAKYFFGHAGGTQGPRKKSRDLKKGFLGETGMSFIFGKLLEAAGKAQESMKEFTDADKDKGEATVEHMEEQAKATAAAAKAAVETKKKVKETSRKLRSTMSSLGLRQ